MRIAVAGTHRNGKTTLAEAVVRARPELEFEPEPYEQVLEAGEDFLDPYDPEAFTRQLEHLVTRLSRRMPGDKVIFDRSPLDFLAYLAARDPSAGWSAVAGSVLESASVGLRHLDLIVWLPLKAGASGIGSGSFRRRVDARLGALIGSDPLSLLGDDSPDLLELRGATPNRVARLLAFVDGPHPRGARFS